MTQVLYHDLESLGCEWKPHIFYYKFLLYENPRCFNTHICSFLFFINVIRLYVISHKSFMKRKRQKIDVVELNRQIVRNKMKKTLYVSQAFDSLFLNAPYQSIKRQRKHG